ncbi:MAG: hypothetical protein K2P68_09185 [Sphingomonas sp.]|nr:hypothetical protein [Sphingomonas sp.]
MLTIDNLVPARRPESDLKGRWGVFSVGNDRWMPLVYNSEREAAEAIRIITNALADKKGRSR